MQSFEFPPLRSIGDGGCFEIVAIARYLPPEVKSTGELLVESGLGLNEMIIRKAHGVDVRHCADPDQCDSDLLVHAAVECLCRAGISTDDLDKIFVNKLLGDRILPPTSSILQKKIGASVAVQCMDIDGGSNGFMQAFQMAGRCIDGGDSHILVASGGIHCKLMNPMDPRVAFLFGDAATALVLRNSHEKHLLSSYEFSNCGYSELHHAVDFYSFAGQVLKDGTGELFRMGNWKDAEDFYLRAATHCTVELLQDSGMEKAEVDWFLVSQQNLPLWQKIVTHLEIPETKTVSVIQYTGNTFAANLPLLLHDLMESGNLKGKTVLLLSLGEGISGGGCIYKF